MGGKIGEGAVKRGGEGRRERDRGRKREREREESGVAVKSSALGTT